MLELDLIAILLAPVLLFGVMVGIGKMLAVFLSMN